MNEDEILSHFGNQQVIYTLAPLLTEGRRSRIDRSLYARIGQVQVAVETPADLHNALAMVRTAEALGAFHFHIIGRERKGRIGRQTMRGTDRWIHLHLHESLPLFLEGMDAFALAGAVPSATLPIHKVPVNRPLCLLFGNEQRGLSKEAIEACEFTYQIPMHGMCESFNLSVACGVSLYDLLRRRRSLIGRDGDLTSEELEVERARCYIRCLGVEKVIRLLNRMK